MITLIVFLLCVVHDMILNINERYSHAQHLCSSSTRRQLLKVN